MPSDISNLDILSTPHSSTFSDVRNSLFCLDNSMLRLLQQLQDLNDEIRHFDAASLSDKSQLNKKAHYLHSLIKKKIYQQRDFTQPEIDMLIREYKIWLNELLYLQFDDEKTGETYLIKAAKRGNLAYRNQVRNTLAERAGFFNDPKFKKLLLRNKPLVSGERINPISNILFLTLTWNPNIFLGNRKRAWLTIDYFYNKFITRFRKKYGKTWVLKSIESTKEGFPHLHLLLICKNSFDCFRHTGKNGVTYRIKEKQEIAKTWNSFVDIVVPTHVQDVKNYIVKDILKQYERFSKRRTAQDFLSLAFCWLFRKQSYSISGFSRDLIVFSIIQTQVERILSSKQENPLIYKGIIKLDFTLPYLKQLKGKPPPDNFIVQLTADQKDSFAVNLTCKPREKTELLEL
ncbi:hypothetical protein ES703_89905 [subsurface metagenome]